ncbi:MAG: hypothetical protein ACRD3F_12130 [Acidobacteriaceae bacterium]
MQVSITQFRRQMFDLVSKAMEGGEVWVSYKGRRFRVAPDEKPKSRLGRITPLQVVNPKSKLRDENALREEMARAWEKDWSAL